MKTNLNIFILAMLLTFSACMRKTEEKYISQQNMEISSEISNQSVTAIVEDSLGYIWIGTKHGLNRYNGIEYHHYLHNEEDSTSISSNRIASLLVDSKSRLWVGSSKGVDIINERGCFHHLPYNSKFSHAYQILEGKDGRIFINFIEHLCEYDETGDSLKTIIRQFDPEQAYVNNCFMDKDGNLWSVTNHHIRCYNGETLELEKDIRTDLCPHYSYLCNDGCLWVMEETRGVIVDTKTQKMYPMAKVLNGKSPLITLMYSEDENRHFLYTDEGFWLYNSKTGAITTEGQGDFPFEVPSQRITALFMDSQNNVWIGNKMHGVVVRNNYKERFNSNVHLTNQLKGKSISSLCMDRKQRLWITTSDQELYMYDTISEQLVAVNTGNLLKKALPDIPTPQIKVDQQERLWLIHKNELIEGTYSQGKFVLKRKHNEINQDVACIAEGADGTIWVGTGSHSIYYMPKETEEFKAFHTDINAKTLIFSMLPRKNGDLVVGLALYDPLYIDGKTGKSTPIKIFNKGNTFDITNSIFEDEHGTIWIGTTTGLYKYIPEQQKAETVTSENCTDVCDIMGDNNGQLWISTANGLKLYDQHTHTLISYSASNGIGGNQFNERACAKLPNGDIVFGGTHGITMFSPDFKQAKRSVPLVFEDLRIHNKFVKAGKNSNIDKPLAYHPVVRLEHDENNFSVSFATLDYRRYNQIHYFYQLEGYQQQWIDINDSREVFLSNIPAGKYKLKVKIANNDQSVEEADDALEIIVKPALWNTWWMRLFYLILVVAIIHAAIHARMRILKERRAAEKLEQEKEQEQRLNQINMSFFANISHEFRTPLTMISAPVAQLSKNETMSKEDHQLINIIKWNVNRMLRLVNQLMDFNKLENDALPLKVRKCDVVDIIRQVIASSQVNRQEKRISMKTYGIEDSYVTVADPDKLDKVMANLMSNAIKFTPVEGTISCGFDVEQEEMIIYVANTGSSIPEDKLQKIFKRYYQVENHHNYGTGIGLYFADKLVQLHHGRIWAENLPSGGVKFTVKLPASDVYSCNEHLDEPETEQQKVFPVNSISTQGEDMAADLTAVAGSHSKTVMLVDDDPTIVNYLKVLLSPHYNLLSAYDADSALTIIQQDNPDIVLSDVSMPRKDGLQLCKDIKENSDICHIPVILVTAKTTTDDLITGLEKGADAYITKPFDPDYLMAMIRTQLANRDRLRGILSMSTNTEKAQDVGLNEQDKAFMDELYALIEKEIMNDELNINAITEKLFISRSKLYYKIKALTGDTPKEFFRKYKLNRAAELLKDGKHNVSEVSYLTGFSSLTVFSRNFKAHFGMTPTEYMKQ